MKIVIETLKDKALLVCVNENSTLKMSIEEKQKQCSNESSKIENRHNRKKHGSYTFFKCGIKGHMHYNCCYIKHDTSLFKRFWVPKSSYVLTNHKKPIKVWVSKSSK